MPRRTHSRRNAVHSSSSSRTPSTLGAPAISTLKLQLKLSSSGVMRNSFCISRSGSVPRLQSMVSFRPPRSVSSRISLISRILPCLIRSTILSMMASTVAVGGIWVISMQLLALS